jgi:hypothetical protein
MTRRHTDLHPARDELARVLAKTPGFDSVGITKLKGQLALSVFLTEPEFSRAALPLSFQGYPVVRKKASEFVPH